MNESRRQASDSEETLVKRPAGEQECNVAPPNAGPTIMQPILAYATYAMQSATVDNVRSAVLAHCTAIEIVEAKQVLWLRCGGDIIGSEMPRRRDTPARSIEEAHIHDILTALQKLDSADQPPTFAVLASDLGKIPRWHPEEMNQASLAERMLRMEQRMSALQETLDNNMAEQLAARDRTETAAEPFAALPIVATSPRPSQRQSTAEKCDQHDAPARQDVFTVINGRGRQRRSESVTAPERQTVATSNRFQVLESSQSYPSLTDATAATGARHWPTITAPPTDLQEVFREPAPAARRDRRRADNGPKSARRVITGRRKSGGGQFKGAAEPGRDLFVYRVHTDTVESHIKQLVTNVGYTVLDIQCVSNPKAKNKSFKLTVPVSQFHLVYSENFPWPDGVRVRKFVSPARTRHYDDRPET